MFERYIKPAYQKYLLDTFIRLPVINSLNPNVITLLSLLTGMLVLPALYFHWLMLATILLLISGYGDSLDGALARATSRSTSFGTVYDIISDRLVEVSVVLGLFMLQPESRGLLCLLMLASMIICITSFLVVGIFAPNVTEKSFHYSPGLMERPEAFAFFIAMIWLPNHFSMLAISFALLVGYTGLNRVREFSLGQKISN